MHQRANRLVIEILRRVVVGAELHRLDGGLDVGNRRNHDDFDEAVIFSDDAEHVEAVDAGQAHVEEHQIDVLAVQDGERRLARRRAQHAIVPPEDGVQRVTHPLVIVDDEDRFRLRIHGENSPYCIAFPASACPIGVELRRGLAVARPITRAKAGACLTPSGPPSKLRCWPAAPKRCAQRARRREFTWRTSSMLW